MQNREYLLLAVLLAAIVASALFFVAVRPLLPALANILMFLVGLFAMGSLSAFHRSLEDPDSGPLVQINFNEGLASSQLETAAKRAGVEVIDAEVVPSRRENGEVLPEDLLGLDNSLALAKLRLDIERELMLIAKEAGLGEKLDRLGPRRVAEELAKRQVLDTGVINVLNDILPVANRAVHGMEVSTDTAAAMIRLGKQLIALIRATGRKRHAATTLSPGPIMEK